jgi:CubicO group peptidase (beta-lactamase class C family)
MRQSNKFLKLLLVVVLLFTFSCKQLKDTKGEDNTSYEYRVPEQGGDGWQVASLSDVGMSETPLVTLMNWLLNRDDHYIHALLIIKDGKLVFEEYFSGEECDLARQDVVENGELNLTHMDFNRDTLHFMASATKSVTSILFGIAMDNGFIQGVNEKMFTFFADYSDLNDPQKDQITIAHMLAMATGLPWYDGRGPVYDPSNDEYKMLFHEDPIRFVLEKDVLVPPGTEFEYNSGVTMLLGEIVKRTSGMSLTTFAENYLFSPLGITSYKWISHRNAADITHASGGLYLRPRDMAKIGQLYLQEGLWNENRIVSQEWVRDSVTEYSSVPEDDRDMYHAYGYGYQWWLGSYSAGTINAYSARGWGGQYIVVIPEKNMVVVHTAGAYRDDTMWEVPIMYYDIIQNYILPAVQ